MRTLHPFPARMAPEIAMEKLRDAGRDKLVLDPMVGSGTVLRHAIDLGHRGIGFDLDPLAVLMTRVATTAVDDEIVRRLFKRVQREASSVRSEARLPWIDNDLETVRFIRYWFGPTQRRQLRAIAGVLGRFRESRISAETRAAADILRIALSRIIITKDSGASLARDVSHSRPHKVAQSSTFDVFTGFEKSVDQVLKILTHHSKRSDIKVSLGDARSMCTVGNRSIDLVLTSPPYLNAIDYLRGHRLSLVWLGYRLSELRAIRAISIGAERQPDSLDAASMFGEIQYAMCNPTLLNSRDLAMVARYSEDIYRMMSEISRVLKRSGRATLVIGNSCIRGTFIRNSDGIIRAASMVGLRVIEQSERNLPSNRRYLPIPRATKMPLGERMRTETILTFGHC